MVREIRQGDVYWFDFGPAEGSEPAGRRPCVVVQGDYFNRGRIATTVVCLITSNLERAISPGNILLRKGDARLPRASVVNVSQIYTVDKLDLVERIGTIPVGALGPVLDGVRLLFERAV